MEQLLGTSLNGSFRKQLNGKVVLVEFWGTWCGPCLNFVPELERQQRQYGEQGFQIVAFHSQSNAETAKEYVTAHPKKWPDLTDHDGTLERSFEDPSLPSLYLF